MSLLDKVKITGHKVGHKLNKHAPAIMTATGIAGLGLTAYLTYQSRPKIEEIIERVEEAQANDIEVDKFAVAQDLLKATALPILAGSVSISMIFGSYSVQQKRIKALAGTLAATTAEHVYYKEKYKAQYGEEEYNEFYAPIEEKTIENEEGEEEVKTVQVDSDSTGINSGMWFDRSDEYGADDHAYNKMFVQSKIDRIELIYFQRGTLLLNEVLQELGFETTRVGSMLGWTQGHSSPNFEIVTHKVFSEDTGFEEPQIRIQWNPPVYVYENFDYSESLEKWR